MLTKINIPFNAVTSGFIAVLVGYTSAVALIIEMANSVGASPQELSSWLFALGMGMGLSSIALSLFFKVPILTAWSTPGAAVLISALQGYSMSEAIGAFIISALLIVVVSASGLMGRLMSLVPKAITSAMLAGVLIQFGTAIFSTMERDLWVPLFMIITYFITSLLVPKFAVMTVLLLGGTVLYFTQNIAWDAVQLELALPILFTPTFSWQAVISISVPLFIVTMTSQNMPGLAMFQQFGYKVKTNTVLTCTGITNLIFAPFGGFAFNLAAITAAICMDESIDKNKQNRYWAPVFAGVFYCITGIFAASVVTLFAVMPSVFVTVLAGLALLNVIKSSLTLSLMDEGHRDSALLTLLVTASGVSFFNIGSAVWGLLAGISLWLLTTSIKCARN